MLGRLAMHTPEPSKLVRIILAHDFVSFGKLILLNSTAIKRKETLDWLYSADYESRYLDLQDERLKGTGEWLLRSPIFQNWIKGKPGSLLLWGRAIGNLFKPSFMNHGH